jgi:transposase
MRRFVEGIDRGQATLFPECLEDWIDADTPVRVIEAFVEKLDLSGLGFDGVAPEATGRPSYHPAVLLKLYIYGYVNRVQSSRRLEREAGRNVEVMWLTGRLVPDHKTIADFRKDSGPGIKKRMYETGGQNAVRPDTLILRSSPLHETGASPIIARRRR